MIGYVTIGVNDVDKAIAFYEPLFAETGATKLFSDGPYTFFGTNWEAPMVAICTPYDGKPATVGNGAMTALQMPDRAMVDRMYAKALALGGTDEGAPGLRDPQEMHFYGAYFRDPEGNKLCVFKIGPA